MFHRQFVLPAPFHQIELFGLVETITPNVGAPHMVVSLYMVCPHAEDGRLLLRRVACSSALRSLYVRGE